MTRAVALAVLVMAAVACGGPEVGEPPLYSITQAGLVCHAASSEGPNPDWPFYYSCVWDCVTWEGQPTRRVEIVFVHLDLYWEVFSEYVRPGECWVSSPPG